MTSKDNKPNTKTSLMDELKSIKGVLNADDDNIPLLLDDEEGDDDIPVLADDEVPVLTHHNEAAANKASLDAAIRQLESMELSPASSKNRIDKTASLEEKIRSNAAPPLFEDPNATTVRQNPFLTKKPADRFAESRKQADDALMSVISHSRALSQSPRPATDENTPKEAPAQKPIEFAKETASSAGKSVKPTPVNAGLEEDASADILKLLGEEPATTSGLDLDLGDDFGELVDIDVDALINEKSVAPKVSSASSSLGKKTDAQINALIDEVVEEYIVILEAALRKKLKEKLPDLLKK